MNGSFGKFFLLEQLKKGRVSEVFRAKAFGLEGFERIVAIKRIHPDLTANEQFTEFFIEHVKTLRQLTHPNIAQIFEVGKIEETSFISLEYVEGKDLGVIFDRIRERKEKIPYTLTCYVISKLCEGLHYAHTKKDLSGKELRLLHLELSPHHILISYEGEVKLIDFGTMAALQKYDTPESPLVRGRYGYMAPEQVQQLSLDQRTDLFGLGIILYELLTMERLFASEDDLTTKEKIRNVDIVPPGTRNKDLPEELEEIVLKLLSKNLENRYQTALELYDELHSFMYASASFFSKKDLADYMKEIFKQDLEEKKEREKIFEDAVPSRYKEVITQEIQDSEWEEKSEKPALEESPPQVKESEVPSDLIKGVTTPLEHKELKEERKGVPEVLPEEPRREIPPPLAVPPVPVKPEEEKIEEIFPEEVEVRRVPRAAVISAIVISIVITLALGIFLIFFLRRPSTISIVSEPEAVVSVLLDGKEILRGKKPPFSLANISPGSHTLEIRASGYKPWIRAIKVDPGSAQNIVAKLERVTKGTGFHIVSIPSGAEVYLEGQKLAQKTPVVLSDLSPGTYQIKLVKSGLYHPWISKATVEPEKIKKIKVVLLPSRVLVTIKSKPSGGTVTLISSEGKQSLGRTPLSITLNPAKDYSLEIKKLGYVVWQRPIKFRAGEKLDILAELQTQRKERKPSVGFRRQEKGFGLLSLQTIPWTQVIIDGKLIGPTPITNHKLSAGVHRVVCINQKFGIRKSFSIVIRAGKIKKIVKKLF